MLTGADGYTTTEVPGDLIIRGSLVLSDENNVDRIHFEGATGSRRRRLSTSSDGVAISLSDADGNTRTIVDSDGNFRSLDARGRTTTRMDGTGFESKDENEQVRFSARVDEGVVVSDEDGAEVVGITDEGVELRRKGSVQADSSVRSLRLTKDGVLSSFDDTGDVERVTISSEEVSVRDTAGSRVVVTDRTGITMHEVDSTSANGRRLTSAGDVERSVSIRMTTSDGTVKTRLDTTSIKLTDDAGVEKVKLSEDAGVAVKDSDGAEVASINVDGIELKKKPSDGSSTAVRSIRLTKEGSFKSYDETGLVEKVSIDNTTVSIRDDTGAETVAITKDAVKLKKADGTEKVSIDRDDIVMKDDAGEEKMTLDKDSLSVKGDAGTETVKVDKDSIKVKTDAGVDKVIIDADRVQVNDATGAEVVKTTDEGIEMMEANSTTANGRRLTSAGDVERSVSIRMTTSDGTVKTRLDTTSIKLTDDAGVEKVKLSEDAGVAVKDSDGAEVASINVDGIELKKKPSDGSSTAVRSIRLTKEGSFKSYDETGLVEKVSIDNTTVSIRDDTGAETVAITKDAVKLKKADGTEKVSIDRDDIVMKDDAGEEKMTLDKDSLSVKGDAGTETVKVDKESITIKTDADASTQVDKVVIDRDEIKMNDATGAEVVKTTTEGIEMLEKDTVSADEERVGIKVKKSDGTIKTKLDGQAIELRREDGSALIKLSNNATSIDDNMTTPLVISSAETDSSIEFGPDLGMRVKSVNGSSRMTGESLRQYAKDKTLRLYADKEGIDIRDGNISTAGSNKLVLSMGVAGLVTYDTAGDVSLLLKREGEIASKAAVEVNDVATLETEYTRELERYSASDRRNVADKVDEKEAEERNEDYTESVYKTVDTVDADDPRDTVDAGRG